MCVDLFFINVLFDLRFLLSVCVGICFESLLFCENLCWWMVCSEYYILIWFWFGWGFVLLFLMGFLLFMNCLIMLWWFFCIMIEWFDFFCVLVRLNWWFMFVVNFFDLDIYFMFGVLFDLYICLIFCDWSGMVICFWDVWLDCVWRKRIGRFVRLDIVFCVDVFFEMFVVV